MRVRLAGAIALAWAIQGCSNSSGLSGSGHASAGKAASCSEKGGGAEAAACSGAAGADAGDDGAGVGAATGGGGAGAGAGAGGADASGAGDGQGGLDGDAGDAAGFFGGAGDASLGCDGAKAAKPAAYTLASLHQDVASKYLAQKAYQAIADGDPRVAQPNGLLSVVVDAALAAGLTADDAKATVARFPVFKKFEPAEFPPQGEAARSAATLTSCLVRTPDVSDAQGDSVTDEHVLFDGFARQAAEAQTQADAKAAQVAAAQGSDDAARAQAAAAAKALQDAKADLDQKVRALRQAEIAAIQTRPDPAGLAASRPIYEASNNLGWLLTPDPAEFSGMSAKRLVGYAPACGTPGTVERLRVSFNHKDTGWIYAVSDAAEANAIIHAESGWVGPQPTGICVFTEPKPGTILVRRFANTQWRGYVYMPSDAAPPPDGFTWTAQAPLGYVYPPTAKDDAAANQGGVGYALIHAANMDAARAACTTTREGEMASRCAGRGIRNQVFAVYDRVSGDPTEFRCVVLRTLCVEN